MRSARIIGLASSLAAGLFLSLSPLHADQWDKKTRITINAPVQIPTTTLQPGTYTLRLLDSLSNRHIVTVWDGDGMKHITTVLAIPNYRVQPTGKSAFTFWETPADQPKALRAWFYPGDNFGQEFAYPKQKAQEIASLNHETVPVFSSREEPVEPTTDATPAPEYTASAVEPEPSPTIVEPSTTATTAPAEEPALAPEPDPVPAATATEPEPAPPAPAPQEAEKASLPQTASQWAGILGAGLMAAVAGLMTFRRRQPQA